MSKPAALQHGSYYHIFNRGNNRENIFKEERNYAYFLQLYARYITGIADTYAYCLLRNHFHFLVCIKTVDEIEILKASKHLKAASPSQQFGNLFNAYAKAINNAYGRTGSLFQNPFGRIKVTSESHFLNLVAYIHQNPEKHGFVDDYRDWPYSSYDALRSSKPTHLSRQPVLDWFNGIEDFDNYHDQYKDDSNIEYLVGGDASRDPKGFRYMRKYRGYGLVVAIYRTVSQCKPLGSGLDRVHRLAQDGF